MWSRLGPKNAALWLALPLGALAACEDAVISGQATLEVDPPSLAFGKVPTGATRVVTVRLRNRSPSADLSIEAIRLAEGSAPVFTIGEAPTSIPRGGEATVAVTYTPDDAEPDAGHLEIHSDALTPLLRVPLGSARTFPAIAVDPSSLDLGALEAGGQRNATITVRSLGDATLVLTRVSLRSDGYPGEACFDGASCRDARCVAGTGGAICAPSCDGGCLAGYACERDEVGQEACLEAPGTQAPTSLRGFSLTPPPALGLALLPEAQAQLALRYAPGAQDRGPAQLILESNDADHPVVVVNLIGRPSDLPPVAAAQLDGPAPTPIQPGTRVPVSGEGSFDPEGTALAYRWRFSLRPEGSRAQFEDPSAQKSAFTVDRPGDYLAMLTVTDEGGLSSTNDARVPIAADAGHRVRLELSWDRSEADLDLHLVSPGAPIGSLGDCFEDNPAPTWAGGDPVWVRGVAAETIAIEDPVDGVYTVLVRIAAPSPAGPTSATVRLFLEDVEVARSDATLPSSARDWDVSTLSWPRGLYSPLDSIR